jgi:patatin-related protein
MSHDPADVAPASPVSARAIGAQQEIRFAIVMYGGISLAIYMHGVAQELLRLVRATSGANLDGDEVAQIYKELSDQVREQRPSRARDPSPGRVPTRFVIDILSGTSAGGINAVFLAKALAIRSKTLDHLRRTWLDMADIDKILNRGGAFEPKRSLLNGRWMYEKLYEAFRDMNDGPLDPAAGYTPVEQLDLFVTTTDLNGVWIPIQLADMNVPERVHTGCFNFRRDNIALAGRSAVDTSLATLRRDDFTPDTDAMLAFACRCTSSFPIAFAPMKLADIAPVIGKAAYGRYLEPYEGFFRWIPPRRLVDIKHPLTIEERELADGGYLDNKPFDHAIDAITFRATTLRHTRKLLFVDPFPENAVEASDQPHFDFVQNAIAGSITLPHYQPIRDQIERVKASNRVQARLEAVQDRTMSVSPPGEFPTTGVRDLARRYGPMYTTYHAVRLFECTDNLARTFGGLPAGVQSEDAQLAVRYIVRAWRDATYVPNAVADRKLETAFFDEFDFSFRMRRATHLLEWAQGPQFQDEGPGPRNADLSDLLVRHLTRLHRRREQLSLPDARNPVWPEVEPLGQVMSKENIKWILEPIDSDDRLDRAEQLFSANRDKFQRAADAVSRSWGEVFGLNRAELRTFRDRDPVLEYQYQFFDYHDMVSLAFLEGSDVSEHTETEIYRISPADGIKRPVEEKLAGYRVQAFGAFLKREWRQNDILWGRLDACERLVSAVLTHPDDEALRNDFVKRLRDAIVRQEADLRSSQDLAPALQAIRDGRLADYLKNQYTLPPDPAPSDSARRLAYAADIFGRMVEEDVGTKNRITGLLRSVGGLAAQLVGLLTPGTVGRIFSNYWLALFALAAGLLRVYGWIAGDGHAKDLGNAGLGAAVVLWFVSWTVGQLLSLPRIPFWIRTLKWLPAIALIIVVVIGLLHLHDVVDAWQWVWHKPVRSEGMVMDVFFLIGRIIVGVYYIYSGLRHFTHFEMYAGYAGSKGVPAPKALNIVAGILLLIGGLSILLGIAPVIGVIALVLFLLPVSFTMHKFWAVSDPMAKMSEIVNFTKNMALMGSALMFLAIPTPWPWSLGR